MKGACTLKDSCIVKVMGSKHHDLSRFTPSLFTAPLMIVGLIISLVVSFTFIVTSSVALGQVNPPLNQQQRKPQQANPRQTKAPQTTTGQRQQGTLQKRQAKPSRQRKRKKVSYPSVQEINKAKKMHGWAKKYLDSYKRTQEFEYLQLSAKYSKDSVAQLQKVQSNLRSVSREFHRARRLRLQYCEYYKTVYLESKVWGAMIDVQPLPDSYCINP